MATLESAFDALRVASMDPEFVGKCVSEQTNAIKSTGHVMDDDENSILQRDEADEASGEVTRSLHSILPEGWVEPLPNALKPSEYLTKLLSEVAEEYCPTLEQLRFLAVLVWLLDTMQAEGNEFHT